MYSNQPPTFELPLPPDQGPIWRSARLERLCGSGVVAFESNGAAPMDLLLPAEAAAIATAAPNRIAEFAAGRACARAALAALGIPGFELKNGADRAPQWPDGIVGSISHTDGFCGAVAAHAQQVLALGLDAETRRRVQPRLWQRICTPWEREYLANLPQTQAEELGTVIFSAKEAFYKAQYPLTRQWLNFSDIAIQVESDYFHVLPQRQLTIADWRPSPWRGQLLLDCDLVFTLLQLT